MFDQIEWWCGILICAITTATTLIKRHPEPSHIVTSGEMRTLLEKMKE